MARMIYILFKPRCFCVIRVIVKICRPTNAVFHELQEICLSVFFFFSFHLPTHKRVYKRGGQVKCVMLYIYTVQLVDSKFASGSTLV